MVVTTPQEVALLDSRKAIRFAEALKMKVAGVVENMSGLKCPHCSEPIDLFKTGGGETAARELGVNFLGRIPIDPKVVQTGDAGVAYVLESPDAPAPKALVEIANGLEERVGHNG